MPAVSIVIAALEAEDTLGDALASALAQSCGDFEIVIAPDEPRDYAAFARLDPRIRILPGVPAPTGPGPARSRALAAARGTWIALLDADDRWSPNYLAALLPAAAAHGAAFGRTSVLDESGDELRSIPALDYRGTANYVVFARAFGSFHGLARRVPERPPERHWHRVFAEDVLFDLETLARQGGSAPYNPEAVYYLSARRGSTTRSAAFIDGIAGQYAAIIAMIREEHIGIPRAERAAAIAVFEAWADMNEKYRAARALDLDLAYQRFVAASERETNLS
jgi:glycosyltransferase involved in cell wall biosynthesis